jgi:molybdenum cofactor synthesis domain-containing protein
MPLSYLHPAGSFKAGNGCCDSADGLPLQWWIWPGCHAAGGKAGRLRSAGIPVRNRAAIFTVQAQALGRARAEELEAVVLAELPGLDAHSVHRADVPQREAEIRQAVRGWIGRCELALVLGGTGLGPTDRTPNILRALVDTELPGFGEAMRMVRPELPPSPILRRCGAGLAGRTLLVWLPSEPALVQAYLRELADGIRAAVTQAAHGG